MKTQHTPAPWHIGKNQFEEPIIWAKSSKMPAANIIAKIVTDKELIDGNVMSNAKLIADAPGMKKLLEEILQSGCYLEKFYPQLIELTSDHYSNR